MLIALIAAGFSGLAPSAVDPQEPSYRELEVPSAGAQDLEEEIAAQVEEDAPQSADDVVRAARLFRLQAAGSGRELDLLLDQSLSRGDALSPRAALWLSTCRIQGESWDADRLARVLEPLLDEEDSGLAAKAAGLLSSAGFAALASERRSELSKRLLEVARDESRAIDLRMRCALAASSIGGTEDARTSRNAAWECLEQGSAEERGPAALALARMGQPVEGRVRDELQCLVDVPSPTGDLARVLLERDDDSRVREERLRDLLQSCRSDGWPEELELVAAVLDQVEEWHLDGEKFTREELVHAALDGMLQALDEHSAFLDPKTYAEFYGELVEPVYGGIGAYVIEDPVDGLITVARPIYSGPAYRAGLMSDDKIVKIEEWPTLGQNVEDVVRRLKGRPGTPVKIYVWRRSMSAGSIERPTEDMAVEILRDQVAIPAAAFEMLPGGIGMVELQSFNRMASQEVRSCVETLMSQGMCALILDLRGNLGGILEEARDLAELFLPSGRLVVAVEGRTGILEHWRTRREPLVPSSMPVVVLINRISASASEIVAGALQDYGRAALIGEESYGKGAVQTVLIVPGTRDDEFQDENRNGMFDTWEPIVVDGDTDGVFDFAPRAKITYARYVLPSGRSIHREVDREGNVRSAGGVIPDHHVAMPEVESWRFEERLRIAGEFHPRRYVGELWGSREELFRRLAASDLKDPGLYPDFDRFQEDLHTALPRDDVRRLLRAEVRRRIQDERGAEFPPGDFQEDPVVQQGIRVVLAQLGKKAGEFEEYKAAFSNSPVVDLHPARIATEARHEDAEHRPEHGGDLETARALLREARDGTGYVGRELIERVLALLASEGGPKSPNDSASPSDPREF